MAGGDAERVKAKMRELSGEGKPIPEAPELATKLAVFDGKGEADVKKARKTLCLLKYACNRARAIAHTGVALALGHATNHS
eukprot:1182569-Prorocentrum_minimum.AAC.5